MGNLWKTVKTTLPLLLFILLVVAPAGAATTDLTITKLANDGSTVLAQETVDYEWMMNNLPVLGDGSTHYYHQGPVFVDDPDPAVEEQLRWNPEEDTNVVEKDMGAVKGTNLKDLCDLVGGMSAGEEVRIRAADGFTKWFAYKNVYRYSSREGPMVVTWYKDGKYPGSGYGEGMRLVWLADTSTNPFGVHAFGNYDWHEAAASKYWYYYQSGSEKYPTTTGLSVMYVSEITIHSDDPVPAEPTAAPTEERTEEPTATPTEERTEEPTATPTEERTEEPTASPTEERTGEPTATPTEERTEEPTATPTEERTGEPTATPTEERTEEPTTAPTEERTEEPTTAPTEERTEEPTATPTEERTGEPTAAPADETSGDSTDASPETAPGDWTLELAGAGNETVTRADFEEGLVCVHSVEWTDEDGNVWGGVPLWLLVGMVDDDPDSGPDHYNFNDDLAAVDYEIKVIAGDDYSATLSSAAIARNDGYIVANTINGEELPLLTESGKPFWPLQLKGSEVPGGQQVGNIVRIELSGLPEPSEGWTLELVGEVGDTITQTEFEAAMTCPDSDHLVNYTDSDGSTWSGVPLWVLLGAVDDIELADHWTFSDEVAASNYTINVSAADGYTRTFSSDLVARNDGYIVANMKNGTELGESDGYPLHLAGPAITSGMDRVSNIMRIDIPELQTPPAEPGSWNLNLSGRITDVIPQAAFEQGLGQNASGGMVEWTDGEGTVYSGIPLWVLCGWVDDRTPQEFDEMQAMAGYRVTVKAADGYAQEFASADIALSDEFILANSVNGTALNESWPLRLVGGGVARDDGTLGGISVGSIAAIELTEFNETSVNETAEIPSVHIVKYGEDQQTIVNETSIDYTEMMARFEVIGDGETVYHYQGISMDPEDIWGVDNDTKGGFKVSNAVQGTRVVDLVSLVGGMGEGTDIVFVASDGYQITLPYSSIYTTPEIQERQGDAVLAWYADGAFVPDYEDGMRLWFMPEDTIHGQWDMHETLLAGYWHYYYQEYRVDDPEYGEYAPGILYPSCAGTSAKYVTEIWVYSVPEPSWTLQLNGTAVGGLEYTVDRVYFESALACRFGANHETNYTDSDGNVWSGMPLWFLCGFADDADQHSDEAYNESLALEGYDIVVNAPDGYSTTFNSRDTVRSSGYIVANSLNGYKIPENDTGWPLRLVGENVTERESVRGVTNITMTFPTAAQES